MRDVILLSIQLRVLNDAIRALKLPFLSNASASVISADILVPLASYIRQFDNALLFILPFLSKNLPATPLLPLSFM